MRSEPPTGDELNRMLVSMKQHVLDQAAKEPAPAKRSHSLKRGLGLGLGVTLLLGVGAGAAYAISVATSQEPQAAPATQTFTPVPSPTPEPAPSATVVPPPEFEVEPGQPASRYGLDCDTLVEPALIDALFAAPVESVDPIASVSGGAISIPIRTSVMAVGGNVCEWSNGVPTDDRAAAPDYAGVTISVVPKPAAGWNVRAAGYQAPHLLGASCVLASSCSAQAVTEHSWVSMEARSPEGSTIDATAWSALLDAVAAATSAAEPPAPPSFAEHTEYPKAAGCETLLPLAAVREATSNAGIEFGAGDGGGGWSNWADADFTAGNFGCIWSGPGDSVLLDWVLDGRWAFERMLQAGTAQPVAIAGLGADDQAVIRCHETPLAECGVDLMHGADWYNVRTDDRAHAIALAEALVATSGAPK